jgi:dephospho-CoA kinase
MARIIIGLAGEMACGKGTVTKHVTEKYKGISHRFSTMLRDVMNRLYIEQNRDNISKISTVFRQNFGEDLFAKVMAADVQKDESEVVVVDGVRRLADIAYLKQIPEFKFVYIEADVRKCYDRIIQRGENVDDKNKTFEKFLEEHQLETELQIKDLKNHADYVIDNNENYEHLYQQIDKIIEENRS